MAYTLKELFARRNDKSMSDMVAAACWRHAKVLLTKTEPTIAELKLADDFLSDDGFGRTVGKFCIAVTVLLDDGEKNDETVMTAVTQIANKFVNLGV